MLNLSGITEIHIMVSRPKNKCHRATLFYSSPSASQLRPNDLLDFRLNEEPDCSHALNMEKEAKMINLLRLFIMEVDDEGYLPLTPPIFEKIWASSEASRFYTPKEGKDTLGLGYPSQFSCHMCTTIVDRGFFRF